MPFTFSSHFHENVIIYKKAILVFWDYFFASHIFITKWILINFSCGDIVTKLWWKCDLLSDHFSISNIFITFLSQSNGNEFCSNKITKTNVSICHKIVMKKYFRGKNMQKLKSNNFKHFWLVNVCHLFRKIAKIISHFFLACLGVFNLKCEYF